MRRWKNLSFIERYDARLFVNHGQQCDLEVKKESSRPTIRTMKGKSLEWIIISLSCLLLLPVPTPGQSDSPKGIQAKSNELKRSKLTEIDLSEAQRHGFAVSFVISLANEARAYNDLALRPRVLAGAADVLWDADKVTAQALFRRAWEAAEKGDAEEVTVKTKDNPPPMVIALRRMSGADLRSEVLSVVARRDRSLAEEFFAKLKSDNNRETHDSKSTQRPRDSWSISEAASKRLQVATNLLNDGQVERALEFASPALDQVNAKSIGFLSELRPRNAGAADQRFALLLARAALDSSSDANTVSGLSSYVFTPGLYITFKPYGGATWSQPAESMAPPDLPTPLRDNFFQLAAGILLRPLPPPDQDFSSSGLAGKVMVIRRLLPLFDQYAPDTAAALRAHLTALSGNSSNDTTNNDNPLLTQGIKPEDSARDALERVQDRIDHAKTSRERDQIYADAAVTLATNGDVRARDLADKVDDSDRRGQVRQFVDFQFVQLAIGKKEASEAARLAKAGELTHTQRALAYTQAARLLMDSQRQRALELLEEAADETVRIEGNTPDRAVLFVGVAMQLVTADPVRAWEIMDNAVRAANTAEDFTGENVFRFSTMTRSGLKSISISGGHFSLAGVFRSLAKNDLYRSMDLAKRFKNDAPRSSAILAIASAILVKHGGEEFKPVR